MSSILKVNGKKDILALITSIVIAEGAGFLSGLLSMSGMGDYQKIAKPAFSPPGWIFPIVWTILYLLMAIAFYRIYLLGKQGRDVKKATLCYFIQLVLNFLWSIIFFRFELYGLAFLELLLLLAFILLTTVEFYKKDRIAGLLMVPYILWVTFAAFLNYSIWILNK
jgi:translocator protein